MSERGNAKPNDMVAVAEQFVVFSSDGQYGATITLSKDARGYRYSVIPTTNGTTGWAKTKDLAINQAKLCANGYFKNKRASATAQHIMRLLSEG